MGPKKKLALWFLIISVSISAVLGILAILTGHFGEFEIRVILSTITISAASICALAAGALWENQKTRTLPIIAAMFAVLAAVLLITGIWTEPDGPTFWRFSASVAVLAIATSQACLISLARLAPRFIWARVLALTAIALLAGLIIFVIYSEVDGEGVFKTMGVLAIAVAALTIMMPIFHRLSRSDLRSDVTPSISPYDQHLFPTVLCPRCGMTQQNSFTEITCSSCGCRFVVTILNDATPAAEN